MHTTCSYINQPFFWLQVFVYWEAVHVAKRCLKLLHEQRLIAEEPVASWDVAQRSPLEASPKETAGEIEAGSVGIYTEGLLKGTYPRSWKWENDKKYVETNLIFTHLPAISVFP